MYKFWWVMTINTIQVESLWECNQSIYFAIHIEVIKKKKLQHGMVKNQWHYNS